VVIFFGEIIIPCCNAAYFLLKDQQPLDFINEAGRNKMISELEDAIKLFNSVEDILNPISRSAAIKYGLTDEVLEKLNNEMYESAKGDL
jgi:hypothetical protein